MAKFKFGEMAKFKFGDEVLFECKCGRLMRGKYIGGGGCEILQDKQCPKELKRNRYSCGKKLRESDCYNGRKMPLRNEIRIWAKHPIMILDEL